MSNRVVIPSEQRVLISAVDQMRKNIRIDPISRKAKTMRKHSKTPHTDEWKLSLSSRKTR